MYLARARVMVVPSLLVLGLLPGCASPKIGERLRTVPSASENYYRKAHAAYADILMNPKTGPSLQSAMTGVVRQLDAAVSNSLAAPHDPGRSYAWPLSRSQLGEILLSQKDGQDHAYESFNLSVSEETGSEHWIPGWLGLAEWAARKEPYDPARMSYANDCLDQAERLLEELKKKSDPQKQDMNPLTRITAVIDNAQAGEQSGPQPTEPQRMNMLWQWMFWNEQWWDGAYPQTAATDIKVPAPVGVDAVYRRLRARIDYQRAEVLLRAQDPPDSPGSPEGTIMDYLAKSLQWDPDYFAARLEMATQLRRLAIGNPANYQKAEHWLRPYIDSDGHPYFRNNQRLWLEAARIYTGWYAAEPGADRADEAERACRRLLGDLDENHAEGNLEYARLLVLRIEHERKNRPQADRRQILQDAEKFAKHARKFGASLAAVDGVIADIARSRAAIAEEAE